MSSNMVDTTETVAFSGQMLDEDASGEADDDIGRGAVNFQPEFSFRPNANNEIFSKFGFGAGNGLSKKRRICE